MIAKGRESIDSGIISLCKSLPWGKISELLESQDGPDFTFFHPSKHVQESQMFDNQIDHSGS